MFTLDSSRRPMITSVEECINELTGVGPSIAHGSHTCTTIIADLVMSPAKTMIYQPREAVKLNKQALHATIRATEKAITKQMSDHLE